MPERFLKPNKILVCLLFSWFLHLLFVHFYNNIPFTGAGNLQWPHKLQCKTLVHILFLSFSPE